MTELFRRPNVAANANHYDANPLEKHRRLKPKLGHETKNAPPIINHAMKKTFH